MIDVSELWRPLSIVAICLARPLTCFSILPFAGGNLLPGYIRSTIMLTLVFIIYPMVAPCAPDRLETLATVLVLLKEVFVGLLIGFVAATVFWTMEIVGILIDNQRGATMASVMDPLYGHSSSPLGTLLLQFTTVVFFSIGGFLIFLDGIFKSYEFWPVFQFYPKLEGDLAVFFLKKLDTLIRSALLLAAPFLIAAFLSDLCLGLISRFVPQLNVFFLSMPVKSGIASFILVVYLVVILYFASEGAEFIGSIMESLRAVIR